MIQPINLGDIGPEPYLIVLMCICFTLVAQFHMVFTINQLKPGLFQFVPSQKDNKVTDAMPLVLQTALAIA